MRNLYLFTLLVLAGCFWQTDARFYLTIDNFFDRPAPLILVVTVNAPDEAWYTPFENDDYDAYQTGKLPKTVYHNTDGALGGQRDCVLGFEGATLQGSVSIISIVANTGSVAFPLGYAGGAYFQYDGDDFGVGVNPDTTPFPGARFNSLPGVGAKANTTFFSERNSDGQTVDLTSAGRALGLMIDVIADHEVFYFIDAYDNDATYNFIDFNPPQSETVPTRFYFPYTSVDWHKTTAQFDWTRVAGLQVRIWTFSDFNNGGGNTGASDAIDTAFSLFRTFGYVITGRVQQDCQCDSVSDGAVVGERMDIFRTSQLSTLLDFTTTNSNGDFSFEGSFLVDNVQYSVCINDQTQQLCASTPRCRTVTLSNQQDPATLQYFETTAASLSAPQNQIVQCGACTTIACLGSATRFDCNGNSVPVTTASDVTSGQCPQTITRTFTDSGLFATQTITIQDSAAPVITVPASDVNLQCGTGTPTLNTWISTQGGAQATDCNAVTWTNNWDGQQLTNCQAKTVTFTPRDACNNVASVGTTATYRVQDTQPPVITTQAQSQSANCNTNGSDLTALNTWLNTNGGATATDNCNSITFTNNFVTGSITRGCSSSAPVIFTVTDSCGNTQTTTATFTIVDNSAPVITTPAQNQNVECNSSSNSAFNTWLTNRANAVATDVCFGTTGLTWTNDFTGSAPFGCNASSGSVTFSVTDNCAAQNTARTTATFTTTDTQAPVITTQAQPLSIDCASGTSTQLNAWLSTQGGAVANDACTAVTWTNNFNSNTVNCASTPVTFTASDQCATPHTSRTTASFSIVDNSPPSFSPAPASVTVECSSTAQASFSNWLSTNGGASVFDNCSSGTQITVSNDWPVGTLPPLNCLSTATVRYTARDPCGNTSPAATATFTISDTIAPIISPGASSLSITCSNTQNSQYNTWLSTRGGAQATDCNGITWSNNGPTTPVFDGCSGVTTVTFTARDTCALTSPTTASFTIQDDASPVLTVPASDLHEECTGTTTTTGLNNWLNTRGGAQATDSCTTVTWTNNFVNLSGGCDSFATVTFTAADGCGRTVSTTATYSLSDTVGPRITTPAQNRSVPCNDQTQQEAIDWVNSNGGAIAVDACDPGDLTWTHNLVGEVISCDFATVTFTVTDGCGLSSSTTATFTSVDNIQPTFNPPAQSLTVECDGFGNVASYNAWVASNGGAIPQDDCALSFTITNNAPVNGPASCGAVTVTFTFTDNCSNTARTTATFTVTDTIAPSLSVPASDLLVECDGAGNTQELNSWVASRGGAVAVDACTSSVTWTNTVGAQIGNSCANSRPYTFRATDGCGQFVTTTASFHVIDSSVPILLEPVEDAAFECNGSGNVNEIQGWLNSNGGGLADDECQNTVVWSNDYPGSGPLTCSSILVTFTISDNCGNDIIDQGILAITDTINPTFTFFPDDVTLPCDGDVSVEALGRPIAVDSCFGEVPVGLQEFAEDEPPIGDCPGDHIITRRWSAIDECANLVTQDQIITVQIIRSSGPCDPEDCQCDECCPPPAASDCIAVPCRSSPCVAAPCQATACVCPSSSSKMVEARSNDVVPEDLIQPLPQCKPVYIYVNDDDDDSSNANPAVYGEPSNQRMIITNEPLHESALKKSSASALGVSLMLLFIAVLSLF